MISCICGADLVVVAKFRAAAVPRLRCGAWASDSEPAWTDMSFPFDHSMGLREAAFQHATWWDHYTKGWDYSVRDGAPSRIELPARGSREARVTHRFRPSSDRVRALICTSDANFLR
ncbi:hypothetical protein GCM10010215_21530 [Streptomyces virginiae]|uniref:Uncharacterized protein n=1 Tax=Streptomyces virginiae TaxID=1961 RepID=A0ABQ3NEJ0_STRVG|nr:hypothetical protein GCM10010215_21530 [Streptomyces virginiae]GHI11148.1 hypothetical protein Scinn_06110 [Streptomyces virginiae]